MNAEAPRGSQPGWRAVAAFISLGVIAGLGHDLVTGHLGWHDVGPVVALPPMLLFVVGGQSLLERVFPVFARRR